MIPRRRTRAIVVDGRPYRWRLGKPRYDREEWMVSPEQRVRGAHLLLQDGSESPGRPAKLFLTWSAVLPVTPEAVAVLIRRALASGWDPSERGPLMILEGADLSELDVRPVRERDVRKIMDG